MDLKSLSGNRKKRLLIAVILVAVILAAVLGATAYARYIRRSTEEENKLSPAKSVIPEIIEKFDGNVKENVYFNVGHTNYPVYVRADIVFTWKEKGKDDGLLYFEKPIEDEDYILKLNSKDWVYNDADGFYYYKYPVKSEGSTTVLIEKCEPNTTFIDENQGREYTLNVEVIVQTVQAVGHTDDNELMSVEDAWNWTPDQRT